MLKYRITTPEQVTFHYTVAGLMSRYLAWLTDQLLIWAGYVIIVYAFLHLGGGFAIALIILGFFILDFGYFTFFELQQAGQTPGKRLLGLRVVSSRGGRLSFPMVLMRNLLRTIDLLPFGMVLGGTLACIDPLHRRLGDLAADTLVVRDVRRSLPLSLANERTRANSFQSDAAVRTRVLTRLTRHERDLIMDLTLRRDEMEPPVREDLFATLATHFRQRLALPTTAEHLSDEQTVVNLALLVQETKFTG